MKIRNILALSALAVSITAFAKDSKAQNSASAQTTPQMRKYKESETGLAYTFSRVNLGGLNMVPAFVNQQQEPGTPGVSYNRFKNLQLNEAIEFNYSLLRTLDSIENKIFFDLNYVHADGNTRSPLPYNDGTNYTSVVHPFFGPARVSNTSGNYPYFSDVKTHFDLASSQLGVSKRFWRTKNIDFSVLGGVDLAYFTTTVKNSFFGSSAQNQLQYAKSTNNVNVVADTATMTQDQRSYASQNQEAEYTRSFQSHYYGAGPLLGAKLQIPFNREFLRLNIKAEASALMGYGSNYFNYDLANISATSSSSLLSTEKTTSRQQHVFRLVPTFRGELSLDVIIKNFMFTLGLQQAVYFQALDINTLVDKAEYDTANITAAETTAISATTRDRLGQITTGGPFVKLSILF